jgi:hypothetical protein
MVVLVVRCQALDAEVIEMEEVNSVRLSHAEIKRKP